MEYILGFLLFFIIILGILFYKMSKPEWFAQFIEGKFTDKDLFTRFVKFLMS